MRKGFTLIELLIVIIIIGVLATAMLLSSGSSTGAAKAAAVVNDLRSMKTAALMFYTASYDVVTNATVVNLDHLLPFMDDPLKFQKNRNAKFYNIHNSTGIWIVGMELPNDPDLKAALKAKAETLGLHGTWHGATASSINVGDVEDYRNFYDGTLGWVWMKVKKAD